MMFERFQQGAEGDGLPASSSLPGGIWCSLLEGWFMLMRMVVLLFVVAQLLLLY
jgi:hypothetical protein